jgi:hypothetical protein
MSSGMLRRVALVRTDVSEDSVTSIIRVTRIGELRTALAVTSNRSMQRKNYYVTCRDRLCSELADSCRLMMEAIRSSEISVLTRATRHSSYVMSVCRTFLTAMIVSRGVCSKAACAMRPQGLHWADHSEWPRDKSGGSDCIKGNPCSIDGTLFHDGARSGMGQLHLTIMAW